MNKENKILERKILKEYIYILIFAIYVFLMPTLSDIILGNKGIDGVGAAIFNAFMLNSIQLVLAILIFIINPIRIIIFYRKQFKTILSKKKRSLFYILVILPIVLSIFLIIGKPIKELLYNQKYNTSKSSYFVSSDQYKTPEEFEKQLIERNLIYSNDYEQLLLNLNNKYNTDPDKYYYEEASLIALSNEKFYDSKDYNQVITFDSLIKAPVYIYNSILILPNQSEKLQYAPISRYYKQNYITGNNYPYFQDYYIECKILYVDGDIYAIIGVSESYNISKYFNNNREKYNITKWYDNNYPYYMILSEKDTITTFAQNKYHSDGSIKNAGGAKFEMRINSEQLPYSVNYPIRKVDKLDLNTINIIAQELQEEVLAESIKYYYNK